MFHNMICDRGNPAGLSTHIWRRGFVVRSSSSIPVVRLVNNSQPTGTGDYWSICNSTRTSA